jgi:hypothetical protein
MDTGFVILVAILVLGLIFDDVNGFHHYVTGNIGANARP